MSEAVEPDSSRLTALAVALFQRIVLTVTAAAVLATMPPDITAATLIHLIGLLGHWGSDPGLSLLYVHANWLIKKYDLDMIYLAGPGHCAPAILANTYLEGTYSEVYPAIGQDIAGLRKFFQQFSFPGGIGSHCTPETPGSIPEGGELGYSLSHAFGADFDHPSLISLVVVGDGESETGPLATAWHSNKFLNPIRDGAVLPVLHLNGYKINNPPSWPASAMRKLRISSLQQLAPTGNRRMSANPVANGGSVRKVLHLPDFREYGVDMKKHGELEVENTKPLGQFLAEVLFVHVIDSMFNQHCKWLDISLKLAWRRPISSLNLLITSTVWRQDHNGFTHQDPRERVDL